MKRALISCLALLGAAPLLAKDPAPANSDPCQSTAAAWKKVVERDGVVICTRMPAGSALPEFRGIGEVEATSDRVFAVVNNSEDYPRFMPYTSECRILQRIKNGIIIYQRLAFPLVDDRDYTLRSVHSRSAGPDGATYRIHWKQANDLGPAPRPGVQRVKVCEGSWLIEPASPGHSRLTYTVHSGTGGHIPEFIADTGSKVGIRKIFDAIRKEVRDPQYAAEKSENL